MVVLKLFSSIPFRCISHRRATVYCYYFIAKNVVFWGLILFLLSNHNMKAHTMFHKIKSWKLHNFLYTLSFDKRLRAGSAKALLKRLLSGRDKIIMTSLLVVVANTMKGNFHPRSWTILVQSEPHSSHFHSDGSNIGLDILPLIWLFQS